MSTGEIQFYVSHIPAEEMASVLEVMHTTACKLENWFRTTEDPEKAAAWKAAMEHLAGAVSAMKAVHQLSLEGRAS